MRVVVTGGAGFLGSYVCETLLARRQVVAIDNLCTGMSTHHDRVRAVLLWPGSKATAEAMRGSVRSRLRS